MSELPEIQIKTVNDLGLDAATAFAKLRTFTPGRGAFLIEALRPDGDDHRYSIVGYRALRAELMPPGVEPVATQTKDMASLARPEQLAAAIASGSVGFASYGAATLKRGLRVYDDEQCAGYFLLGCTVMVFDHKENTVTVAGRRKGNLVERCIYEATHAPDAPHARESSS